MPRTASHDSAALESSSERCYYLHQEVAMRTTIALDDELIRQAQQYTGIEEKAALVREALTRLVRTEAARRLAALGGSDPNANAAPRRRAEK
jgi:Arc/MetJ family transcription regulator